MAEMDTPVDELGLSTRAANALYNLGVDTLADILEYRPAELMEARNFGRVSLAAVVDMLSQRGLKMKSDFLAGHCGTCERYRWDDDDGGECGSPKVTGAPFSDGFLTRLWCPPSFGCIHHEREEQNNG